MLFIVCIENLYYKYTIVGMKSIHHKLEEHITWYRNWHRNPHVDEVHYLILVAMASLDLCLGITLLSVLSQAS
jgi:hypothetical protein